MILTCWVALTVAYGLKITNLNIELRGIEVKEINSEFSLVDFTADIHAHGLQVLGPSVRRQPTNVCRYRPEDVARFNSK